MRPNLVGLTLSLLAGLAIQCLSLSWLVHGQNVAGLRTHLWEFGLELGVGALALSRCIVQIFRREQSFAPTAALVVASGLLALAARNLPWGHALLGILALLTSSCILFVVASQVLAEKRTA